MRFFVVRILGQRISKIPTSMVPFLAGRTSNPLRISTSLKSTQPAAADSPNYPPIFIRRRNGTRLSWMRKTDVRLQSEASMH
jgi:hypothetical protein